MSTMANDENRRAVAVYLDPKDCEMLADPNALSIPGVTVWRNGARIGDRIATPYVDAERVRDILIRHGASEELLDEMRWMGRKENT